MKNEYQSIADVINKATYDVFMKKNPALVDAIAQALRMGETPAKIEKHLNAKFPARPITTGLIRMVSEHQNKLEKEN